MQLTQATKEDLARWKRVYAEYRARLRPNRISGAALYAYLDSRYPLQPLEDERTNRAGANRQHPEKQMLPRCELPPCKSLPDPVCCVIEPVGSRRGALSRAATPVFAGCDILAGIDLVSGYFLVEGSSALWDELYAHRGLNEADLENAYCVAEYIACLSRFGMLEETILK